MERWCYMVVVKVTPGIKSINNGAEVKNEPRLSITVKLVEFTKAIPKIPAALYWSHHAIWHIKPTKVIVLWRIWRICGRVTTSKIDIMIIWSFKDSDEHSSDRQLIQLLFRINGWDWWRTVYFQILDNWINVGMSHWFRSMVLI